MARTPLMKLVLQALRTVRQSSTSGIPLDELAAMQREPLRPSRRTFLQVSAAAVGAAALAACEPAAEPREVVIVGGGIAGLHCAWRLRRLGVEARLYEASSRLGGRMLTGRNLLAEGQSCELGGELIDTGHATLRDLAQELGIELLDYTQDDPRLSRQVAHFNGTSLSEQQLLEGLTPFAARIDAALGALRDPEGSVTYRDPNGAEALDSLSLSAWMDREGFSRQDPVRQLLELAYVGEYGLEPDVTNCLNLLLLISTDTTRLKLFGESDERFRAREGNDTYVRRLAEGLGERQLHLQRRLVALGERADGRYLLTFQGPGGTEEVKADHVVLALPFTLLREVQLSVELPPVKRKAIAELGYGTNTKIMVGFSSRPWRTRHGSDGNLYSDVGKIQTWETSRLQPGDSGILTWFTGGKRGLEVGQGTAEQQAARFLGQLESIWPGTRAAASGRVVRMYWPGHELVKGSYSAYRVGQYTTLAGAEGERVGNLHFCGEHTSLDAQGYMEGGALSGAVAAAEVAEALGLKAEEPQGPGRSICARARQVRHHGRWLEGRRRTAPRRRAG
jgi:monoamine oxidase